MSLWDTLLVNGTDLITMGCVAAPYEFPYNGAPQRGDLAQYAGIDGVEYDDLPYDAGLLPVTVSLSPSCSGVSGNSWTSLNDAFRALRILCRPDRPSVLVRQMEFSSGQESHTANAKLLDIVTARPVSQVLKCLVEFDLLDGCWFGGSQAIPAFSVSGAPVVKGDVRTMRITATLSAGAVSPTVANTTNGYSFTYVGTVPAGGVTVDVLNRRATTITGSINVSNNLRWAKKHPFRMEPGANSITVSSGTVAFSYYPAYL
jgi:hypothetical protein